MSERQNRSLNEIARDACDVALRQQVDSLRTQLATAQAEVLHFKTQSGEQRTLKLKAQSDLTKRDEAVERLKAAYERSESERLFAQGRMENQLNQKLQLKLDLEKRDEVLRVAVTTLSEAGWSRCGCPGHWTQHAGCHIAKALTAIHSCLGTTEGGEK